MMATQTGDERSGRMKTLLVACIIAFSNNLLTGITGCTTSEFQCIYQSRCIPLDKRFNGVNDCYDNSDETPFPWCQKVDSFRCTSSKTCIPITYRNDGQKDCADKSDEEKLIGGYCNNALCCPCEWYVNNSYCDSTLSQCSCRTGYYTTILRNDCIPRIIGDSCSVDTDCSGAIEGSQCSNGKCACEQDWFEYANGTACWHLLLGDSCSRDSLCYAGIAHAYCQNGICNCTAGYIWDLNDRGVCRNRLIGVDHCDATADCGIAHSRCGAGNVCLCTTMYTVTLDSFWCTVRAVNESCSSEAECAGLGNANCTGVNGQMVCTCTSGYKASPSLDACINNMVGDRCSTDADCSIAFIGGYCTAQEVCGCTTGYLPTTTNNVTTCRRLLLGTDPCPTDFYCITAVPNSMCADNNTCVCGPGYERTPGSAYCVEASESTDACDGFVSCTPWAIPLIIIALLVPPLITGLGMYIYKKNQDKKAKLTQLKKAKYGKSDPYSELGMAAIPTITNFTAPHDTALHRLPEIAGLVIRDRSFFRDLTSINSKDELMPKVDE